MFRFCFIVILLFLQCPQPCFSSSRIAARYALWLTNTTYADLRRSVGRRTAAAIPPDPALEDCMDLISHSLDALLEAIADLADGRVLDAHFALRAALTWQEACQQELIIGGAQDGGGEAAALLVQRGRAIAACLSLALSLPPDLLLSRCR